MMELIKPGTKIDFVGKGKLFSCVSLLMIALSIVIIFAKGFNLGIDFAGGTAIHMKFNRPVSLDEVRESLSNSLKTEFSLQDFGAPNEVLIRIVDHTGLGLQEIADDIKKNLNSSFLDADPEVLSVEQVGSQVGEELRKKAFYSVFFASIGILIYIALRFEFVFALGALVSLIHDIIIILGVYSFIGKEFTLTSLAALLTAAGYSLNDTIVIFDRIREKIKSNALLQNSWKEVINLSINETLSRTILTSVLTLLVVLSLLIFGGQAINGFAFIMAIGIIIGTYSSIAIATIFLFKFKKIK